MRLALLVVALATLPAAAQTAPMPGSCALGTATAVLDAGDVSARVFNLGSLFYGNDYAASYFVPKRDGKSPIYVTDLWLAGKVNGELRVAGGTYGGPSLGFTFWPGPLGADARPLDPADCSPFDRIYTIARTDVEAYFRTGVATPDLRDWPYQLGAPVLDGDGDPANYDLAAGDQPAITGIQTAWWIMNDVGGPHVGQQTPPLGVEVRVEASTFGFGVLGQTTLYRYTLTNRTAAAIDSAYVGWFADPDLGDAGDDLVGTDTTTAIVYIYNDDNVDGTGSGSSYGLNPPAVGFQVVSGPVGLPNRRDDDGDGLVDEPGERLALTGAPYICKSGRGCNEPNAGLQIYRQLQGLFADGSTMRAYGNGFQQTQGAPTRFVFPGDPVAGRPWSAPNPGVGQSPIRGDDKRVAIGTGPFRLGPGETETVVFGLPFARGTDHLDSVSKLRGLAGGLREVYAQGLLAPRRVERSGATPPVDERVRISLPAPNPFRERAAVRYEMPAGTRMRATLTDVRGRQIAVLFDGPTEAPSGVLAVDGRGLAAGVYRVRIVVGAGERLLTLVRVR